MSILDFKEKFPDEQSCRMDFKEKRENEGIECKRCKGIEHFWLSTRYQWKCKDCEFRTTLRSGTIMEHSNLSFLTWYKCMAFMGMSKKPLSAHEMRRQLGMKRYQPVWYMMKKIRKAMGQRDDRYLLSDMVEFDEAYFSKATPGRTKLKRGKGSQRKQNVAVMAEAARLEDIDTGQKSTACRYFKMKVLESSKADGVNSEVSKRLDEKSVVLSDKATNFVDIMNYVEGHIMFDSSEETTNDQLKWVHIAISNAKRTLLGIYHQVAGKNLQDYLNEFCYKLNRRYFGNRLYDRIIIAAASGTWCTKAD